MKRAYRLALKAHPSPNPKVGAVIVKDGKIIAEGYHKEFGSPHAEKIAIEKAKDRVKGSTIYVTLEPCNHYGKTPPCTELIIKAGIKKVIIGQIDPDPLVKGKGIERLKKAGIEVVTGIGKDFIKELYYDYNIHRTKKRPGVRVKLATSIDGKIATYIGDSKWLSSLKSRTYVHRLRNEVDAIMIGKSTLLKDNPSLSPYLIRSNYEPIKIIVATKIDFIPEKYKLFQEKRNRIIIAYNEIEEKFLSYLTRDNIELLKIEKDETGKIDLKELLYQLGDKGIISVMAEGGGKLTTSLIEKRLVDRLYIFLTPKLIGEDGISWFQIKGINSVSKTIKLKEIKYKKIDDDLLIKGEIEYV